MTQGTDEAGSSAVEAIEANYTPDGNDWTITVTGRGQTLTGTAPEIIAARDRADQLVEKIAPSEKLRTVVHMLSGDAVAFTSTYLSARLAKPTEAEPAVTEEEDDAESAVDSDDAEDTAAPTDENSTDAADAEEDDGGSDKPENDEPEDAAAEPAATEDAAPAPAATEAAAP